MENPEKQKLSAVLSAWMQNHSKIIFGSFAAIIIILLVIGIVNALDTAKNEKALAFLGDFEATYNQWETADDDEKDEMANRVQEQFSTIDEDFSGTYVHQRGLFMMGDFYYSSEDYSQAKEQYLKLEELYKDSYLAPVSLYNAAAASEGMGEPDQALKLYRTTADEYPDSPLSPRALFSAARLTENTGADEALSAYNELIELHPQSNWTKLARARIIKLNIGR